MCSCRGIETSGNKKIDSTSISYFNTEDGSYMYKDVYARFRDSVYILVDSTKENCVRIEKVADFNKDGYKDVLIEFINGCGGNCCGNSYMIYFYNGQTFEHSDLVGNDWDGIEVDSSNNTYTFEIEESTEGMNTDLRLPHTNTFQLKQNKLVCIKTVAPLFIEAEVEIRSADLKEADSLSYLLVDLNGNEKADTISCRPWERWGRMFWEIHFDDGTTFTEGQPAKRIGVLSSVHNGYSDIILDFDQKLIWEEGSYK